MKDKYLRETREHITEAGLRGSAATLLPEGSLLVTTRATIGSVAIAGRTVTTNQGFKNIVPNGQTHPEFFYYCLQTIVPEMYRLAIGSTFLEISKTEFERICVQRPQRPEQAAIAAVLDTVDEAIRQTGAVIEKLKKIKTGLLHDLLTRGIDENGELRDPAAHPEQFKNVGSLGMVPKGWKVNSVAGVSRGPGAYGANAAAMPYDATLPRYVRITDIMDDGRLDPMSKASISGRDAVGYMLSEGDLLFARSGATVGKTYLYDRGDGPSAHAGYVIKFQIDPSLAVPRYVFFWTQSAFYWSWIATSMRQGAQPNINAQEYGKHEILVPPLPEQAHIVGTIDGLDGSIRCEQTTRAKLMLLKQGLMQDLLTGRVRVPKEIAGSTDDETATQNGNGREANIYFKRSVLAAEIVDQMHRDQTFGHVKFMKALYLVEQLAEVELAGNYHRAAAGPLDNRMIRSVDSQMKRQKWFDRVVRSTGPDGKARGYAYVPMDNAGGHRQWFEKYWGGARSKIQGVIDLLKPFDSQRCEIIATLYEAWRALAEHGRKPTDDAILDEVLLRWHEKKQEVPRDRWAAALGWMRGKGLMEPG